MAYCGYIVELKELFPHPNADNLVIAKIFGTQCIVSKDYAIGKKYVFFPADGQLSEAYCAANDLVRRKDENGNDCGGYLNPERRNVKTIRLRKEVSEGLLLPIESLSFAGDISTLNIGDSIDVFNGVEICRKYIPRTNKSNAANGTYNKKNKPKKKSTISYVFPQHIDTEQLRFCLDKFHNGDFITITEKLHGTSFREILTPVTKKNNFIRNLFHLSPKIEYRSFCGSRRTVIESVDGGFYGNNNFRIDVHNQISPHLTKNLIVFGEIVGWTGENGSPIMGEVDTTCLQDKEFTKKYGKIMTFNYGCAPGTYDFYIYRICQLDDDGNVFIEFSTSQIAMWCERHGFKMVPVLWQGFIPEDVNAGEWITKQAQIYHEGDSTLAPHIREGCVVRRENNAWKFDVAKSKSDYFKILTGIQVEKINNTNGISQDILEEM